MTKLEKLNCQFEKEETCWKEKMRSYTRSLNAVLKQADSFDNDFESWSTWIEIAKCYASKMTKLDTEHKKFLRRWQKRFRRALIIDHIKRC